MGSLPGVLPFTGCGGSGTWGRETSTLIPPSRGGPSAGPVPWGPPRGGADGCSSAENRDLGLTLSPAPRFLSGVCVFRAGSVLWCRGCGHSGVLTRVLATLPLTQLPVDAPGG